MNYNSDENLRHLFESFYDSDKAGQAAEDVFEGERILRENPAPRPSEGLKAQIKTRVGLTLMRSRKVSSYRFVYQMAAAAAVIIIVFAVTIKTTDNEQMPLQRLSFIPAAVWDSNNITRDDADLLVLTAKIDQAEQELAGAQLTQYIFNGTDPTDELEMELINIDTEFWKG
jgi:hypothetical protein